MMHKEIVAKKRVPVIYTVLFSITILLYLSEAVERTKYNKHLLGYLLNSILVLIAVYLIIREVRSCCIAYKYSVIADKLIINSITSKNEKNLESIKISNILYIGDRENMPKEYNSIFRHKSYSCNILGEKKYYCIYKNNNIIRKIKFQPSERFIDKILKCGELKCNLVRKTTNKINKRFSN